MHRLATCDREQRHRQTDGRTDTRHCHTNIQSYIGLRAVRCMIDLCKKQLNGWSEINLWSMESDI